MAKVSFDFDSTLSKIKVQELARKLIDSGHEVWVVTPRISFKYGIYYDNTDLYGVAERIGIKYDNVFFTEMNLKRDFLVANNFHVHVDDDVHELNALVGTGVVGINVCRSGWKNKVMEVLKNNF